MTTTQTGGGNGAAPDGGSGRKLPTRRGWWWREGNRGPYIEEVDGDQNHAPFLAIDGSDVVDDGSWLAPIPGPAVLVALESYSDMLVALAGRSVRLDFWGERLEDLQDDLADAIREERDGERNAAQAGQGEVDDARE